MITPLHSVTTATTFFATHELPEEVQEPVLRDLVMPRVISSSMTPTLRAGDCLEIGPAEALQVGDLVVFRQQALFICHRIVHIEDHLYTKGDAGDGPPEQVYASDIVGRVTAILRSGIRLSIPPSPDPRWQSTPEHHGNQSREQVHLLARNVVAGLVTLPLIGRSIRRLVLQLTTVDVMEQAPLRSITSYIKRRRFRLAQIYQLGEYIKTKIDPARTMLIVRAGPLVLGTCKLCPWSLQLRPSATALGVDTHILSLCGLSHIDNTP